MIMLQKLVEGEKVFLQTFCGELGSEIERFFFGGGGDLSKLNFFSI
jgi:hypothetical protein